MRQICKISQRAHCETPQILASAFIRKLSIRIKKINSKLNIHFRCYSLRFALAWKNFAINNPWSYQISCLAYSVSWINMFQHKITRAYLIKYGMPVNNWAFCSPNILWIRVIHFYKMREKAWRAWRALISANDKISILLSGYCANIA